jgi:hypothetical protein
MRMKKLCLLLLAGVLMFSMAACSGGGGDGGGSKADVTDEKGIISLDLAGDFSENKDYEVPEDKIAGIELSLNTESEYYSNGFRPTFLLGTISYSPASNWVDSEVQAFHSYTYAENKKMEEVTIAGMKGKMASYEENGKIKKHFFVVGEPNSDGVTLTLRIICGSGSYSPSADEDYTKIVNSVSIDKDAAKKAMEE